MKTLHSNKRLVLLTIGVIFIGGVMGVQRSLSQTVDERLKRVVDEIVKMDYDTAMNDMNEVLKVDANNALAFEYRGLAHVGKREFALAVADYTKAIELRPGAASFYSNRAFAVQLLPTPDYSGAYDDLTHAIAINPKEKGYYLDRGYPSLMKKDWEQAANDYTQAIALGEKSSEAFINRGMAYLNLQYYSKSIADSQQALAIDPGNAVAKRNLDLAIAHRKESGSQKAIEKLLALGIAEATPSNESPETAQKFARVAELVKAEDHTKAGQILNEIIAAEPTNAKAYYYRAVDLYEQGNYSVASQQAAEAIKRNDKVAKFYYLRAICRGYDPFIWRYDQIEAALKDLDKAVELDPSYAAVYGQKAQMLFRFSQDNPYSAKNAAEEAVRIDPKDGDSYFIIGLVDIFRTIYKEALTALNQAVAAGVNTNEVYEARGYVNFETKNREQAIADYQRSLALDPDNPVAKKDLELLLAKSKYTLYPPEPPAANKWIVKMQELLKTYNDEVDKANYWSRIEEGSSQDELCRHLSGWNTSLHNSNNYAVQLWALARDPQDKKDLSKLYDDGLEIERKSKAKLDAQNCVF